MEQSTPPPDAPFTPPEPEIHPEDEKPRLRPLEAYPIDNPAGGPLQPKLLVLRDPSGLAPEPVTLPPMGAAVIHLCDGTRTRAQILADFHKQFGAPLSPQALDAMLKKLDDAYLLDSMRFKEHAGKIMADFARAGIRDPLYAGRTYPADRAALEAQIEGYFAPPNGPGLPPEDAHRRADAPPAPRAIITPHVDFSRGGPAYAWAFRPLLLCQELPSLIVVLGTDHGSMDPTITLTRKHFETPLGRVDTDVALVEQILEDAKAVHADLPDGLIMHEHRHRGEHALELPLVFLRYVMQRRFTPQDEHRRPPRVLPILCGSLDDFVVGFEEFNDHDPMRKEMPDSPYAPFLRLLKERVAARAAEGESVLWLCTANLAHVGPRYGDQEPIRDQDFKSLEHRDKETLRPVVRGDADGWFREIRREKDARRVCGLSPIYAMLKAATPPLEKGQLRCYAQCQAESGSVISVASIVF